MGTPTNLRSRFKTASPPRIFVVPQPYLSWYYRLVLIIGAFFPADAYARAGLLEYQACVSLDAQINVRVFGCSEIIADKSQPHATLIEALLNRAAAYKSQLRRQEQIADLTEVLRQIPSHQAALDQRASANFSGSPSEQKQAFADYSALISIEPLNYLYFLRRASLSSDLLDYGEALRLAETPELKRHVLTLRSAKYELDGMEYEAIADLKLQLPLIPADDGKNNSDLLKKLMIEKIVRLGGASK